MAGMNTGYEGTGRKYDNAVFERHVLANGITVWLQKPSLLPTEEGILMAFLPRVGSRLDPPHRHGAAHFFEHLPFRGTTGKPSKESIVAPIESIGGTVDASTGMEFTRYLVECPVDGFELASETVFELVARPLSTEEFVEKERGAIAQEYRNRYSNGDSWAQRHLYRNLFGEHPLGHFPIGDSHSIARMDLATLRNFHQEHYHGGNIHVVCGGSFAERIDALDVIDRYFGEIPPGEKVQFDASVALPFHKCDRAIVTDRHCQADSLTIVYPLETSPRYSTRESTLAFLGNILGSGLASPLFTELREKRSLVYNLRCSREEYFDVSLFYFFAKVESNHFKTIEEAWRSVLECLDADFVVRRQRERQLGRRTLFTNAIRECHSLVDDVTKTNRSFSCRDAEAIQDASTVDEVLGWRDYFLNTKPFVCEIRSK